GPLDHDRGDRRLLDQDVVRAAAGAALEAVPVGRAARLHLVPDADVVDAGGHGRVEGERHVARADARVHELALHAVPVRVAALGAPALGADPARLATDRE